MKYKIKLELWLSPWSVVRGLIKISISLRFLLSDLKIPLYVKMIEISILNNVRNQSFANANNFSDKKQKRYYEQSNYIDRQLFNDARDTCIPASFSRATWMSMM